MVTLRAVESSRQLTKSTQNSAPVSKARIAGLAESHLLLFLPSLPSFFASSPLSSFFPIYLLSTYTCLSILILSSSSLGIKHSLSALIHRFHIIVFLSFFFYSLFILIPPSPISQPLLSANRRFVQPINPTALFVPTTSSNSSSSSSYLSHLLLFFLFLLLFLLISFPQFPPRPSFKVSHSNTADLATLADPNELFLPGERQNNLAMSSSPVPLLKPPVPGNRGNNSGSRPPKLTLGIPPSPNVRPVTGTGVPVATAAAAAAAAPAPAPAAPAEVPQLQRPAARPAPPQLRLKTPMGSSQNVQQVKSRPAPPPLATTGLNEPNGHSRSGSFTYLDGKASGPASASSSNYSALSFAMGLRQPHGSTPDPSSAISVYSDRESGVQMERDSSVNSLIPDLDKMSLEKGRPLDVDDLDDEAWLAASEQKKIVELGSLGEGAGGAVTRCKLKEGKTVFALKVGFFHFALSGGWDANALSRLSLRTPTPM